MPPSIELEVVDVRLAVCRFDAHAAVPAWLERSTGFVSTTRTADELSVICDHDIVPAGVRTEGPWRAFRVRGPLVMTLIGVVASLANPLADAGISIFALSTFDTDYILVHEPELDAAVAALTGAGHSVDGSG
jgi:hypothetical protein